MPIGQLKINAIRLVSGTAVLDFLNTCDGRRPGTALTEVVDKLSSMDDIVHWFLHAGLIDSGTHRAYLMRVKDYLSDPLSAFRDLINLRELLYQLFLPVALGGEIDAEKLGALNEVLARTASRRRLVSTPSGTLWYWLRGETLEETRASLLGQIAFEAATLLTSSDLARLKACATPNCDWLFIDNTKNGARRWCQMNICGSRDKARRLAGHVHG